MPLFNIQEFLSTIGQTSLQRSAQFRCRIPIGNIAGTSNGLRLVNAFPEAAALLERGILCESTRTPSRSFETASMTIYGYEEKYPVFTTYTDLECTFYTPIFWGTHGPSNGILKLFTAWQNLIHEMTPFDDGTVVDHQSDLVVNFPDNYRLRQGMVMEMFDPYNARRNNGQIAVGVSTRLPIIGDRIGAGITFGAESPDPDPTPTIRYRYFNVYPQTVESSPVSWGETDQVQKITVTFTYSYWLLEKDIFAGPVTL